MTTLSSTQGDALMEAQNHNRNSTAGSGQNGRRDENESEQKPRPERVFVEEAGHWIRRIESKYGRAKSTTKTQLETNRGTGVKRCSDEQDCEDEQPARQKGRLQQGADADIVVFDAETIHDHSTFEKPMEPSVGVRYLVVGGTVAVDEGKIVPDVFPGRALPGPRRRSASHD
jgi:hypothetical protein